jgi:hypothetical protein
VHMNAWPWMVVIQIVWIVILAGVLYVAVKRAHRHVQHRSGAPRQRSRML